MGADFYNETPSRKVAVGDASGLREEWQPVLAQNIVDRRPMPLTGSQPWVSIHALDLAAMQPGDAAASRGLIVRSWKAVLGGKRSPIPHVATFATEWGQKNFKTVVELVPPPGITALKPGDFVEADFELVMFPANAGAYYGPNQSFRRALEADPDSWRLTAREAIGNSLEVAARHGKVQHRYPLRLAVGSGQRAEVAVTGGLGYLPVTFTGLKSHRGFSLLLDGKALDQSVHGNDFWQTDYDLVSRTWSLTWNVLLDHGTRSLKLAKLSP
jgi:hypothetical protein